MCRRVCLRCDAEISDIELRWCSAGHDVFEGAAKAGEHGALRKGGWRVLADTGEQLARVWYARGHWSIDVGPSLATAQELLALSTMRLEDSLTLRTSRIRRRHPARINP